VVPCHNEQANIPILIERLQAALQDLNAEWELILVDDHSSDETFTVAKSLASTDSRVKALRLARNVGSHIAILCGTEHAKGDAIAVLAADLQDPPELIPQMYEQWSGGHQIVWAVREGRLGVSRFDRLSSKLFNRVVASLAGTQILGEGADFFLIDRAVSHALQQHKETNVSVFALLQWMGFRQTQVYYTKQARLQGTSSWSARKKLKLFVDSIISFSFLPIRLMSLLGMFVATIGFLYALVVIANSFAGNVPSGWTSMIVVVLILGGIQILMLGVLGEYLWRNLAEARQRPRYLLEETVGLEEQGPKKRELSNRDAVAL
jgi:dolichol-phosphate mannosyltransferase